MSMGWKDGRRWVVRSWWAAGLLVAAQQGGLIDVKSAEACSGGVPGVGWDNLRVPVITGEERAPIATDGFVLLRGAYVTDELADEVPLPWVRATNEADEELPGKLRVLRTQVNQGSKFVYLGWQADEPLPQGSVVKLSFAQAGDAGAGGAGNAPSAYETVELEVVGEPTPLPVPTAGLETWVEVRHGIGPLVECESTNSCGSTPLQVPIAEERVPGVLVSWQLPSIAGLVAWEVWAETSDVGDAATLPTPTPRQLIERELDVIPLVSDVVAFASDASEHCAVMVVKDLRTGEESRSDPACGEPEEPSSVIVDHDLASCDEPPTPDSSALWCLDNAKDERCADLEPAGPGGNGGSAPDVPNRPDGGQTSAPDDSSMSGRASKSRTSSACSYAPPTGNAWLTMVLGALGLAGAQRARRRDRARSWNTCAHSGKFRAIGGALRTPNCHTRSHSRR